MLGNVEHVKNALEQIRDLIQQNLNMAEAERRGMEVAGSKGKGMEDAEAKSFYRQPSEPKKRRGVSFFYYYYYYYYNPPLNL